LIQVAVIAPAMALRVGLREVLGGLPDVSVVAEAARLEDLTARGVDLLVLASPVRLASLEFDTGTAVLLLTDDPADVSDLQNLALPAWGILPVNASEDELGAAVRALSEDCGSVHRRYYVLCCDDLPLSKYQIPNRCLTRLPGVRSKSCK
jgi:hypothetical protein